jgi:3-deoxy-D-manno-octulosonic-acid transferase
VKRFVSRVHPSVIAVVEQELWPNMILNAPCPVVLVNARMSERSAENYRRLGGVFRRVMHRIDLVLAQNDEYADRYRSLGARRVETAGNLKFDALPIVDETAERARYRTKFGERLLVAGSTSEPEEQIVLDAYRTLRGEFPDLKLVIAPRHLERVPEIRKMLPPDVGLLDTMGELYKLYCAAAVTFVGGSFAPRGGQSIIEPASLGKPMVTGPGLQNFADVAEKLKPLGVLKIAETPSQVAPLLAEFLRRPELGEPGRRFIRQSAGCTRRVAESILKMA